MFRFFKPSKRPCRERRPARAVLALESLEARYCLSSSSMSLQDVWAALAQAGTVHALDATPPVNQPPVISNFGGNEGSGSLWTFSGKVTDPDGPVQGLTVTFGTPNLPSLNGKTTTVDSTGWFHYSVVMGGNENGTATALTVDTRGAMSNLAMCNVHQT